VPAEPWRLERHQLASTCEPLLQAVAARPRAELKVVLAGVTRIDSAGVAMLRTLMRRAAESKTRVSFVACSEPAREAISLFQIDPRPPRSEERRGLRESIGAYGAEQWRGLVSLLVLAADTFYLTFRGSPRTARVRRGATWREAVKIGVDAFPIVGLVALLIGLVVGLQSAAQLQQLGVGSWVAELISLSMAREMGPLMTAIIVAGRSGASIAAEIAVMKVSQEVDALSIMGINPTRYIVVPKFVAMTLTLPCLTIFTIALGIFGGFLVSYLYLDLSGSAYWSNALDGLHLNDMLYAMIKSVAFAWIIVLLAAHRGLQAYGGAESVGRATTMTSRRPGSTRRPRPRSISSSCSCARRSG
jgi:phospholipid/cholesterol/gamma-HCH transport system permease protein